MRTSAYQGHARGFPPETILAISEFAIAGRWPDLTVLLDLPLETGFARMAERHRREAAAADRIEREGPAFHARVREGFLALARLWPGRIRVVDAARDEEAVAHDIWELTQDALARAAGSDV